MIAGCRHIAYDDRLTRMQARYDRDAVARSAAEPNGYALRSVWRDDLVEWDRRFVGRACWTGHPRCIVNPLEFDLGLNVFVRADTERRSIERYFDLDRSTGSGWIDARDRSANDSRGGSEFDGQSRVNRSSVAFDDREFRLEVVLIGHACKLASRRYVCAELGDDGLDRPIDSSPYQQRGLFGKSTRKHSFYLYHVRLTGRYFSDSVGRGRRDFGTLEAFAILSFGQFDHDLPIWQVGDETLRMERPLCGYLILIASALGLRCASGLFALQSRADGLLTYRCELGSRGCDLRASIGDLGLCRGICEARDDAVRGNGRAGTNEYCIDHAFTWRADDGYSSGRECSGCRNRSHERTEVDGVGDDGSAVDAKRRSISGSQ